MTNWVCQRKKKKQKQHSKRVTSDYSQKEEQSQMS